MTQEEENKLREELLKIPDSPNIENKPLIHRDIVISFMEKFLTERDAELVRKIEEMKKCVFESDGDFHCCYNGCEGRVENCKKCHKDICDNKKCPNGKSDNGYNYTYNSALSDVQAFVNNIEE